MTTSAPHRLATGLLLTALTAAALAACSGERPDPADLKKGLTADSSLFPVAEQQAACAAKLLTKSDLSDEALRAIADSDADYTFTDEETSDLGTLQVHVLTDCAP
ncbi:MAG: hypothetical protein QM597_09870 [Aeromicrobium sp.]|uniref:hypothetical protein n=1 Tax=Aeromicrobium sp. TaxID=1871063 RepID=UPI0039E580F7